MRVPVKDEVDCRGRLQRRNVNQADEIALSFEIDNPRPLLARVAISAHHMQGALQFVKGQERFLTRYIPEVPDFVRARQPREQMSGKPIVGIRENGNAHASIQAPFALLATPELQPRNEWSGGLQVAIPRLRFTMILSMAHSVIDPARSGPLAFTSEELTRYARHLVMPEVGMEGQRRLKAASVLCIGTGGLGSPIALYLAAAGVGRIGLVDADTVDASNLQRQILHGTKDVGRKKLESARDRLTGVNPCVQLDLHDTFFTAGNAMEIAAPYDVVVDGTDNFPTRYLSNDVCVFLRKPNVYGSIYRFEGQCSVFAPHLDGGCYRCMVPEPPPPGMVPTCAEGGVLGVLPGMIGTLQALEAIKLILGIGDSLIGRLLHFDAMRVRFREFQLRRDPDCPVCGDRPTIMKPVDYNQFCGLGKTPSPEDVPVITARELKTKFDRGDRFTLVDVREPEEFAICRIPDSRLIPLGELPSRMGELDRSQEIVLQCKMGGRSLKALHILKGAGFEKLWNLTGGILAWADEVDPATPKY